MLLRPLIRPQTIGLGLGLSYATLHSIQQKPMRLDTTSERYGSSYFKNVRTPVIRNGKLNPGAVRQISSGSIIGLCAGLLISTFSKSLALLVGLGLVVVQVCSSASFPAIPSNPHQVASRYGITLIPYNKLQKYVTDIDIRSAVQDNVAFKISFGTTFALAAFVQF